MLTEGPVTLDDFMWVLLGAGFVMSIAYVRAELLAHRARTAVERERITQQQKLFPTLKPAHTNSDQALQPSDANKGVQHPMSNYLEQSVS